MRLPLETVITDLDFYDEDENFIETIPLRLVGRWAPPEAPQLGGHPDTRHDGDPGFAEIVYAYRTDTDPEQDILGQLSAHLEHLETVFFETLHDEYVQDHRYGYL